MHACVSGRDGTFPDRQVIESVDYSKVYSEYIVCALRLNYHHVLLMRRGCRKDKTFTLLSL
jgi:hypothetical protein